MLSRLTSSAGCLPEKISFDVALKMESALQHSVRAVEVERGLKKQKKALTKMVGHANSPRTALRASVLSFRTAQNKKSRTMRADARKAKYYYYVRLIRKKVKRT
jgi:hypothetical protein